MNCLIMQFLFCVEYLNRYGNLVLFELLNFLLAKNIGIHFRHARVKELHSLSKRQ